MNRSRLSWPPPRWTAIALSLAAGLAAGLAHPPFGFLPGLLGFGLMMALAEAAAPARPLRSAFFRGWLAGVGYFAVGVWWVTEPFQVDPSQTWMAPFALVLLASGLGLFWGAAAALYRWSRPRGLLRAASFAGALAALEWARGHVLTGFPWNLPGEAWAAGSPPSQAAAAIGVYGLSWVTILLGALPALAFDRSLGRRRIAALATAVVGVAALYGAGAWRLHSARPLDEPRPVVRIVQANIDQKEKWRPENLPQIVATYAALSQAPGKTVPDVVIWPEGALPAVINDLLAPGSPYIELLASSLQPGQSLMMGANRASPDPEGGPTLYFNSLIALRRAPDGLSVSAVYDKWRLVPFGEFMPAGGLASRIGLRSLVNMPDDFTSGPFPRPMEAAGLPPVQPLICYEALFPGLTAKAAAAAGTRPRWIVNVSNDAWFGYTSGPLQHLNMARYRAIEEGLPLVRATPTGVSAVIDSFGRISPEGQLGLGKLGIIDAPLPPRLQPTLYSLFAETTFFGMLLLSAFCMGATRFVRRD